MDDLVYHYTTAEHARSILADGELRPSAAGAVGRERPALWFTSRPTYEPTAVKMFEDAATGRVRQLTLDGQAARFGLARFVAPASVAPLDWGAWARQSGVRTSDVKRMARRARDLGSDVALYRATFDAVPVGQGVAVETSADGRTWDPLPAPQPRT